MRFEIKTGGAILILVGLAGLSVVVFALGLFAGYDMARNTAPEAPQAASVYPAPNPPPGSDVATNSSDDAVASKPQKVAKVKASAADSGASLSMDKNAGPVEPPASRTIENASASMPPPKIAPPETSGDASDEAGSDTSPPEKVASAPPPVSPGAHRSKPFNIQIDAVMDRTGADQMTQRLQKLGYHAFMVPTQMSGQTWWRVRVGPYNSQEEASAAEQELRAKYKDAYAPQ
jgi:cell division septation protein DedD